MFFPNEKVYRSTRIPKPKSPTVEHSKAEVDVLLKKSVRMPKLRSPTNKCNETKKSQT
jgi:hypothetical protein